MIDSASTPQQPQLQPFPEPTARARKIVTLQILGSLLRGTFHIICFPLFLLRSHSISRQMASIITADESQDSSAPAPPSS